jgi:hypothetical protein
MKERPPLDPTRDLAAGVSHQHDIGLIVAGERPPTTTGRGLAPSGAARNCIVAVLAGR